MCTAVSYQTEDHYFGRTLDLEYSYAEQVVVTPRRFPFSFRREETKQTHYAMIGMATVCEDYPLYYEATNEAGLSMAGLNFPGYACFSSAKPEMHNVAVFELIPWVLGQCETVEQAVQLLEKTNVTNDAFRADMPAATLHWMLCDRTRAMTLEITQSGQHLFDNPAGVLTNNPPFDYQMTNLSNYMILSAQPPAHRFAPALPLAPYCKGMGAMGLPGDLSSVSRFVRAAFARCNSVAGPGEGESVNQFFHILGTVQQPRGCAHLGGGKYEITVYTSCCNTDKGIYYYTTYENNTVHAVSMHKTDLEADCLFAYPLLMQDAIVPQN